MISFEPKEKSIAQMFGLMLGAISPRPIAFVSTIDKNGKPNLAPFSFFNAFGANPPIIIFSPSRRGRDNTTKHTFENVKEVPEVVINVVNFAMVQQCNLASNELEKGINEFEKAGFTTSKSDKVKPSRVKESPVQMECKVIQIIETGHEGGAGNLVICEIIKMHINEDIINPEGVIDPHSIDLVGRMGANYYVRASGNAIFEVEKPGHLAGIGIDNLPRFLLRSEVLSGNDLGKLGNLKQVPKLEEIINYKIENTENTLEEIEFEIKSLISANKLEEALIYAFKINLEKF